MMEHDPLSAAKDLFSKDAQEQIRLDVDRLMQGGNRALTAASDFGNDTTVKPAEYGPRKREFEPTTEITPRIMDKVPALYCTLYRKADGGRSVTVTEGFITHHVPKGGGDGVQERVITGIWDIAHSNLLAEHAITTGKAVGVLYPVDKNGYLLGDGVITVAENISAEVSDHYIPPVGDDLVGAAGSVFVILARLEGTGDSERLRVYHEGNITHYHDLPPIQKVAGEHDIFKRVNPETGLYETKGISAGDGIEIDDDGDSLTVRATAGGGLNLNLEIYLTAFSHDVDGHLVATRATYPEVTLYFRNGLLVSKTDPDDGDPPVDLTTEQVDRTNA